MAYSKTEQTVYDIAAGICSDFDAYVYDVEYVKEGSLKYLRIYVDKDSGIFIDDCENISRAISVILDEKDPIKENYILEVSSPGIERKLTKEEHFKRYIDSLIDVYLYKAINGNKQITGNLISYSGDCIEIKTEDNVLNINLKDTSSVKLHFDF